MDEVIGALGLRNQRELEQMLAHCHANTAFFSKTFFPDVFFRPWSGLHLAICKILDDESLQKVAIAAPRGFGKTSLLNMSFPAKRIVFQDSKHIIPVSATSDAAIEQADDLKEELVTNELIRLLFGNMQPEDRRDPFGMREWVTSNGCKVRPRGAGQQIRGRKFRSQRPDLFIIDDLEDDEGVESEEQRTKLWKWFNSAVINSVDRGSKTWRVIVIGTILHEQSLLNRLLKDPSWFSVRYELCDDLYRSNWPEFMTDEDIKKLAEEFRANGNLRLFYMEYRNRPIATEEQGFKEEYFQAYDDTPEFWRDMKVRSHDLETVILTDPARTMKDGSCKTSIAAVAVNRRNGCLYVREVMSGHFSPPTQIEEMFNMAERWNALVLAPEVTGLNEYITWPIRNEMLRRKKYYHIVEVKPREGKTGPRRSGGMMPLYKARKVWHNRDLCGGLERNLLQWPRPEEWDDIDAVSGIIFAMEEGERFLGPMEETEPDPETVEDEYKELDYDEDELVPLVGTFV